LGTLLDPTDEHHAAMMAEHQDAVLYCVAELAAFRLYGIAVKIDDGRS
jgi:hypothetical protein